VAHRAYGSRHYTEGFRTFNSVKSVRMAAAPIRDPDTFRSIYDEHERGVYAAALRILGDPARAQDVTQDVFLKLWRHPQKFDVRRGQLGPYLKLMGRSRALDLWREGQAAGRASDRLRVVAAQAEGRIDESPVLATERDEARMTVRTALRCLPSAQREALVLAYWGGMTADEIARRSDVPLGTAKSRIRLGLARLREECGDAVLPAA
jgi:RNA polymerase sigma-70 factor (ECF subfamily)